MRWNRRVLLAILGAAVVSLGLGALLLIGPRNVLGMLRYDTRREGALKVGDAAPDVELLALSDGTPGTEPARVRLRQHLTGRPLVLIFGSFTWPPFRRSVERLQQLARRYAARADFLTVYIREAHPTDEWQMPVNEKESVCYPQPRSTAARIAIASDFRRRFGYEIPLRVDPIENPADQLYAGWPERLYVVDERGLIAYKGKTGPFGFHPEEVEAWLAARFGR